MEDCLLGVIKLEYLKEGKQIHSNSTLPMPYPSSLYQSGFLWYRWYSASSSFISICHLDSWSIKSSPQYKNTHSSCVNTRLSVQGHWHWGRISLKVYNSNVISSSPGYYHIYDPGEYKTMNLPYYPHKLQKKIHVQSSIFISRLLHLSHICHGG